MTGHNDGGVQRIDFFQGAQPLGGIAAQCERDRIYQQIARDENFFLRQVKERIARRDRSFVMKHLDLPFAEK